VLYKPLFFVALPDLAGLIALFPDFGAVLAIDAQLIGGPECRRASCYQRGSSRSGAGFDGLTAT
jgi:hypothetical protein